MILKFVLNIYFALKKKRKWQVHVSLSFSALNLWQL